MILREMPLQHISLLSSAIKKKLSWMRPSDRIATYKSRNTAIKFFSTPFLKVCFLVRELSNYVFCFGYWNLHPLISAYRNMFEIFCSYLLTLRPGSHEQVFCTIFWHQSCETSCKSMTHYCGHLPSITLNSPCEKENQTLESFADF